MITDSYQNLDTYISIVRIKGKSLNDMKKLIILLVATITMAEVVLAQQDPQYSQYMLNTMIINPAFAGSRGVSSVGILHRSQWMGLDGAPTTETI